MNRSAPKALCLLPAPHGPATAIRRQHRRLSADSLAASMLDSFAVPAAILNDERQIVLANEKLRRLTGRTHEALIGIRMGLAIGCEHGSDAPGGCGTAPACAHCGGAQALEAAATSGMSAAEDYRVTARRGTGRLSLDHRVLATPLEIDGERFTVFAVRDTSDEQRRRVLERMFFHDVLNSAVGLRNLLQLSSTLPPAQASELIADAANLASQVVEEIKAQADLAAAERGELSVSVGECDVRLLLEELASLCRQYPEAAGKRIVVSVECGAPTVRTDRVLLRRVLGNLVRNAVEASGPGQTVSVTFDSHEGPAFAIHNQSVMSEAVQFQVFRRSFSTKAESGRGVGTYSARLLTERYLHGRLSFTSAEGEGTTFTVTLPGDE